MKSKLIKAVLLTSFLLIPSIMFSVEITWLDKVVAHVEDDVILDSEFKRRMVTIKQQLSANNSTLPSDDILEKQVLDRLILEQIQLQLANRAGLRISDDELNAALNRIAESSKSTIGAMRTQLETDGMNFSLFREDIRNEMIVSRYRQGAVSRNIFVSDQEVDDLLLLMKDQGASSVQYHLRHLMLAISDSAGPDDIDKVRGDITALITRFKGGEDFSQLVIAESNGSDALTGGDLGWKTIEQLPTLFAGSVSNLTKGQVSEPIRSSNGLHLLMLEDVRGNTEQQMVDEVHYRHILIKLSTLTNDAKAEAILLSVRKEISDGNADFAEQAKVISEDLGTATDGGDLGWASPRAFQQLYQGNTDALTDGELSSVFKGADGWYLVERLGSRVTDQTEEVERSKAMRILQSRKFDEEQETWLREIRESAYVKILDKKD